MCLNGLRIFGLVYFCKSLHDGFSEQLQYKTDTTWKKGSPTGNWCGKFSWPGRPIGSLSQEIKHQAFPSSSKFIAPSHLSLSLSLSLLLLPSIRMINSNDLFDITLMVTIETQ